MPGGVAPLSLRSASRLKLVVHDGVIEGKIEDYSTLSNCIEALLLNNEIIVISFVFNEVLSSVNDYVKHFLSRGRRAWNIRSYKLFGCNLIATNFS